MGMPLGKLATLVGRNAARNRRHFALSAFGVVVGIAAFVFFLGLSMGVRGWVLEMFPIDRVEVTAPRTSLVGTIGLGSQQKLDDSVADTIRAQAGVVDVVPRMAIAFPTLGTWWYESMKLSFDVVGDGIEPSYLADTQFAGKFKDWEAEEGEPVACGAAPEYSCPELHYCDKAELTCHHRVPILVSRVLVETYNTQYAKSRGLPVIGAMEEFIVQRGGLGKMKVYINLGSTMIQSADSRLRAPPRQVEGVLLGISEKAVDIGMTVPIGYVKRWNREYLGEDAATTYSSFIVKLEGKGDVGPFAAWVERDLGLVIKDSAGKQFAMVIFVVTIFFLLISLIIVTISAINIAHTFFMQVSERRREIGLLRAVGATRGDIRGIFLGEAALLGIVAGVLGVALALLLALGFDAVVPGFLPELPLQPDSLFDFQWWILIGAMIFSVLSCVFGGFLPARKAARVAPARALAQQ